MKTNPLAWLLLAMTAGCTLLPASGAAPLGSRAEAAAARGFIDPSQIVLRTTGQPATKRLAFAAWLYAPDEKTLNGGYYLIGPGAPSEPLWADSLDEQQGFAAANLVAGHYRIEQRLGTKVVTQQDFELVTLPGAGRENVLVVDPRGRTSRATVGAGQLEVWIPVDIRGPRKVTIAWFHEGTQKMVFSDWVVGPSPGSGLFAIAPWEPSGIAFTKPGHHEIAVVSEGAVIGSWSFDAPHPRDSRADTAEEDLDGWHGLDHAVLGSHGAIHGALHPDPNAKASIAAALAENAKPLDRRSVREYPAYPEVLACACADDPAVNALVAKLRRVEAATGNLAYDVSDAHTTLGDRHATADEKANARGKIAGAAQIGGEAGRLIAQLQHQIAQAQARYHPGCLARFMPESLRAPLALVR